MQRWIIAVGVATFAVITVMFWPRHDAPKPRSRTMDIVVSNTGAPVRTPVSRSQAAFTSRPAVPNAATNADAPLAADAPSWMRDDPQSDPRVLYARLRKEPRDGDWAIRNEGEIRSQLSKVPYIGGESPPQISCRSSICEVSGTFAKGTSNDNINVAMSALQGTALRDALQASKLKSGPQIYGGDANGESTFTLYYLRSSS